MRSALTAAGISVRSLPKHLHSCNLPREYKILFRFVFARHPLTWYQSYFTHQTLHIWTDDHIDRHCQSADFCQFVTNVLDRFPEGYCSQILYRRYFEGADFVGRFEKLKTDLFQALNLAGEKFDRDMLDKHPPKKVGKYYLVQVDYNSNLRSRVLKVEQEFIGRFYK